MFWNMYVCVCFFAYRTYSTQFKLNKKTNYMILYWALGTFVFIKYIYDVKI